MVKEIFNIVQQYLIIRGSQLVKPKIRYVVQFKLRNCFPQKIEYISYVLTLTAVQESA